MKWNEVGKEHCFCVFFRFICGGQGERPIKKKIKELIINIPEPSMQYMYDR